MDYLTSLECSSSKEQKASVGSLLVLLSLRLYSHIIHEWLRSVDNFFLGGGRTFYYEEVQTSIGILKKDSWKRQNALGCSTMISKLFSCYFIVLRFKNFLFKDSNSPSTRNL